MCWIVSSSQTVLTDTCLSVKQLDFLIEQCYTVKEQQETIQIKDSIISSLMFVVDNDGTIIAEKDNENELLRERHKNSVNDCTSDKKGLTDKIKVLEKNNRWQKLGLCITAPIAIIESAGFGVAYLLKK